RSPPNGGRSSPPGYSASPTAANCPTWSPSKGPAATSRRPARGNLPAAASKSARQSRLLGRNGGRQAGRSRGQKASGSARRELSTPAGGGRRVDAYVGGGASRPLEAVAIRSTPIRAVAGRIRMSFSGVRGLVRRPCHRGSVFPLPAPDNHVAYPRDLPALPPREHADP